MSAHRAHHIILYIIYTNIFVHCTSQCKKNELGYLYTGKPYDEWNVETPYGGSYMYNNSSTTKLCIKLLQHTPEEKLYIR